MNDRHYLIRFAVVAISVVLGVTLWLAPVARAGTEQIDTANVQHEIWQRAAKSHGLDPLLLFAISVHESGRGDPDERREPWPYAINTPKGPVYGADRAEAEQILDDWENDDRLGVGLMQIHLGSHRSRVSAPQDLIDPATNVRIGAAILAEAIEVEKGDVWAGVARYHSADPKLGQRYKTEISDVFHRLKRAR